MTRAGPLAAVLCALALHGAVALVLVSFTDDRAGAGGTELEAVSVEVSMISASALESRMRNASSGLAGADTVDLIDGAAAAASAGRDASTAEDVSNHEPTSEADNLLPDRKEVAADPPAELTDKPIETHGFPSPPKLAERPDDTPDDPEAVTLPAQSHSPQKREQAEPEPELEKQRIARPPLPKQEPPTEQASPQEKEPKPEIEPKADRETIPPPRAASAVLSGGAAARQSAAVERPSAAAAAASPGAINRFNRSVVAALARTRPKGLRTRRKGTVKIAFAIADDGRLVFVRAARSSGSSALDAAAIAAIRRATFPAPPPGLTLAQRTYEVPYHFR